MLLLDDSSDSPVDNLCFSCVFSGLFPVNPAFFLFSPLSSLFLVNVASLVRYSCEIFPSSFNDL